MCSADRRARRLARAFVVDHFGYQDLALEPPAAVLGRVAAGVVVRVAVVDWISVSVIVQDCGCVRRVQQDERLQIPEHAIRWVPAIADRLWLRRVVTCRAHAPAAAPGSSLGGVDFSSGGSSASM